jgi:hypothetical protein
MLVNKREDEISSTLLHTHLSDFSSTFTSPSCRRYSINFRMLHHTYDDEMIQFNFIKTQKLTSAQPIDFIGKQFIFFHKKGSRSF